MSVFTIGDTHLSLMTEKPMDIFGGWENYVERLEKNWKKLVKPEDTVVVLGDISWALNYEEALEDFKFLNSLPGRKILIKGNHDFWWQTASKNKKFVEENSLDTIEFVFNNTCVAEDIAVCGTRSWFFETDESDLVLNRELGRMKRSIECAKHTGKEPVLFLHYPPLTTKGKCEQIYQAVIESGVKECYYAHLHGYSISAAYNGTSDGVKFKLVSADSLGFMPYCVRK